MLAIISPECALSMEKDSLQIARSVRAQRRGDAGHRQCQAADEEEPCLRINRAVGHTCRTAHISSLPVGDSVGAAAEASAFGLISSITMAQTMA
jgi:hypothetical protein